MTEKRQISNKLKESVIQISPERLFSFTARAESVFLPLVYTVESCYPATALLGCGSVPTPRANMKTEESISANIADICINKYADM